MTITLCLIDFMLEMQQILYQLVICIQNKITILRNKEHISSPLLTKLRTIVGK
jgi:hypothetical protein